MSQLHEILRELIYQNEIVKSSIEGLKRSPTETFFQFGSPLIVVIIATIASYFSGRYFFGKEYEKSIKLKELDKGIKEFELAQNKEKEIAFKKMEIDQKEKEELRRIYVDANKHQQSYIMIVRTYVRTDITFQGLVAKYRLSDNAGMTEVLKQAMEDNKKSFADYSSIYRDELKNFIAPIAAYKILKNGDSKINEHLDKLNSGLMFFINKEDFLKTKSFEEVDTLLEQERQRFSIFWKQKIKDESKKSLDIILRNE
jgi:hypothetical protein